MRNFIIIAAVMVLAAGGAQAKPCKDAKGHFIKCPVAASAPMAPAAPPMSAAEMKAKPKKLSKADVQKELAGVQVQSTANQAPAQPANKLSGLRGLFKPKGSPVTAPSTPMAATSTAPLANSNSPAGHPVCKKGKPCGNSCIAQNKVCHKV
jgi:hypothetical protein